MGTQLEQVTRKAEGVTFLFSKHGARVTRHANRKLAILDGRITEGDAAGH